MNILPGVSWNLRFWSFAPRTAANRGSNKFGRESTTSEIRLVNNQSVDLSRAVLAALCLCASSAAVVHGEPAILELKHPSSVNFVAFSPIAQLLASGSEDKTIKLWDVANGRELRTFSGHSGGINAVAFSPDGKVLASASQDKTIKLWDVTSGRELQTLTGHSKAVNAVAFSPEGKLLASGGGDNTIKLWNAVSGRELQTLSGHSEAVNAVVFSPDEKVFASGSWDETIRLWDVDTWHELRTLSGHSAINSVTFSPNSELLASGDATSVRLWDVKSGRVLRSFKGEIPDLVPSVTFTPDGRNLVSVIFLGVISVWDVATGRLLLTRDEGSGGDTSVAISKNGKVLARGSQDGTVKLWEVARGPKLRPLKERLN